MSTLNTYNLKSPDSANTNIALDASGNIAVRAGSAASPSIYVTGDSNTGIYSPGADQVAISTGGSGRLFVDASGNVGVGSISTSSFQSASSTVLSLRDVATSNVASLKVLGGAGAGAIAEYGATNGIGFCGTSGAHAFTFYTNSAERLRITSAGLVGVGTSSPSTRLHVRSSADDSTPIIRAQSNNQTQHVDLGFYYINYDNGATSSPLEFQIDGSTRMALSATGLGVGTTSPSALLTVGAAYGGTPNSESRIVTQSAGNSYLTIGAGSSSQAGLLFADTAANNAGGILYTHSSDSLEFVAAGNERARIDSSGRLLVGTSSSLTGADSQFAKLTVQGNTAGTTAPGDINLAIGQPTSSVAANNRLGFITFADSQAGQYAQIGGFVDGTPGTNDYPGRLVFSTTADGASSPTERMRIINDGDVYIGQTSTSTPGSVNTTTGLSLRRLGQIYASVNSDQVLVVNRNTNDGNLVLFNQDGTQEGNISVSGTTVSYNGAHLSRWSQLSSGAERIEILRGSVLSNIDEMCEWGDEDNEQLNRMKVSDVEGDKNVAGVFQAWDDDDDTYTNDFYCAMTGDFIIRIGAGVTVERGDLLMSAGDGTAKPQDDDIIRSKTIAKVTSTNVTCTYEDGSYCVPCVLMAC